MCHHILRKIGALNVISPCYGQQVLHLSSKFLVFQTWVIAQAIIHMSFLVMKLCVLNQS
jgi:hypothetical protein